MMLANAAAVELPSGATGDTVGIVLGILLGLWALREFVPIVQRLQGRRHDEGGAPSGRAGDRLEKRLAHVETRLGNLEVTAARIDERVGMILRDSPADRSGRWSAATGGDGGGGQQ